MENGLVATESAYEYRRRQWSIGRRRHIVNQTNENSYGIFFDIGLESFVNSVGLWCFRLPPAVLKTKCNFNWSVIKQTNKWIQVYLNFSLQQTEIKWVGLCTTYVQLSGQIKYSHHHVVFILGITFSLAHIFCRCGNYSVWSGKAPSFSKGYPGQVSTVLFYVVIFKKSLVMNFQTRFLHK